MSISDGFSLWIGKELAELAMLGIGLVVVFLGVVAWAVVEVLRNRARGKRGRCYTSHTKRKLWYDGGAS